VYDLDASKDILEETFGIMVYQEQVMLLSQKLANFTKGQADSLRKAMGKKDKEEMDKLYSKFIEGCVKNGHDEAKAKKIWNDMEKFAAYAFNKSHSTCYALIAYQSGYLKANYPSEFMAGLMSNNMSNSDDIKKYIEVSKRMGIEVLGPDVNESDYIFTVNEKGQIRFGLSAIKGVGENVIIEMVSLRDQDGNFEDIYDFVSRLGSKHANKKVLEALAISGAFDCFEEVRREQYFGMDESSTFIESLIRYSNTMKKSKDVTTNLFGESLQDMIEKPKIPTTREFTKIETLEKEKEVLGIYMSGHPLDKFKKLIREISVGVFEEVKMSTKFENIIGLVKDVTFDTEKTYIKFNLLGLEDSILFTLRNKNVEEFGKYIEEGRTILMQVKWDIFHSKSDNRNVQYFKIQNIVPEANFYNLINKIIFSIDIPTVNMESLAKLQFLFESHEGTVPVIMSIETPMIVLNPVMEEGELDMIESSVTEDSLEKVNALELKSTSYKIKISEEFLTKAYEILGEEKVRFFI
jgi:DNA polymerase III subunit alpha